MLVRSLQAVLGQVLQHQRQFIEPATARLGGQQRTAQPRFVGPALGQQGDQFQVPELRVIRRGALRLLEHRPRTTVVALIGQHAHLAAQRGNGQRLVTALADAPRQGQAARLLAQRLQGIHQDVEGGLMALVQALGLLEQRRQHALDLLGAALLHPEHGRLRQRVRRQRAQVAQIQRLRRCVLNSQRHQHLGLDRQRQIGPGGAAVLVFAARSAVARVVALQLGQPARAPAVLRQRHGGPQRACHGPGTQRVGAGGHGSQRAIGAGKPVAERGQ